MVLDLIYTPSVDSAAWELRDANRYHSTLASLVRQGLVRPVPVNDFADDNEPTPAAIEQAKAVLA